MLKVRNRSVIFGALIALVLVFSSTEAQDYTTITKIRYLKSFTKYVEWPTAYKTGDFIIGVLNKSSFADALTLKLKDRKVGTQSYKVINFAAASVINRCHVIFIPTEKSSALKSVLAKVKKYSTLVVTDKPGLAEQGSGINLVKIGPKQQFEINQKSLDKCQLSVSASLNSMASKVIK